VGERTGERVVIDPSELPPTSSMGLRALTLRHEIPETHVQGHVSIENAEQIAGMDLTDCDLGVQIAWDGRLWLCVNGVAWVRFKPNSRPPLLE
jgi:hypothetical protein